MIDAIRKTVDELFEEGRAIDEALRRGVQEALLRHKQLGNSVIVWEDGKVVRLRPEDIPVNEPRADQ